MSQDESVFDLFGVLRIKGLDWLIRIAILILIRIAKYMVSNELKAH